MSFHYHRSKESSKPNGPDRDFTANLDAWEALGNMLRLKPRTDGLR
jgi:hypothetical protein